VIIIRKTVISAIAVIRDVQEKAIVVYVFYISNALKKLNFQ